MDVVGICANLDEIKDKGPKEVNPREWDKYIVLLRAKGEIIAAIGKRMGVSKVTVINTLKNYSEEVRRLQLAEMEELIHEHRLTLRQRVEDYAKDLSKLDSARAWCSASSQA